MEGEALVRLWPGSRLLAWGFRQALLRASSVTCLPPWAQCEGRLFFLKFLAEMEIGGGPGSERGGSHDQGAGHLFQKCFHFHFSFFTLV